MGTKTAIDYSSLISLQSRAACLLGKILRPRNGDRSPAKETEPARILVVKTDEIGDFVLATPFLRELRRLHPKAGIVLVVNPVTYNLAELCPYVDEILVYRQGAARFLRPFVLPWRAFRMGHSVLRERNFDLALMPRWDMDGYYASYIAHFSGARRRIGFSERANERKRMVNRGFDALFTDVLREGETRHEVERSLDVIRYLGGKPSSNAVEVWIGAGDEKAADGLLAGRSGKTLVALCPGAGAAWRRWPKERFAELAKRLKRSRGASAVIVGGKEDRPAATAIQDALGGEAVDAAGRTTLRQTAALLKRCRLFVGNDTGSMHLAAAMGVPVVEISCFPVNGPDWHWNSPLRFGPWGVPNRILQPKGHPGAGRLTGAGVAASIEEIAVDRVERAADELFQSRGDAGGRI